MIDDKYALDDYQSYYGHGSSKSGKGSGSSGKNGKGNGRSGKSGKGSGSSSADHGSGYDKGYGYGSRGSASSLESSGKSSKSSSGKRGKSSEGSSKSGKGSHKNREQADQEIMDWAHLTDECFLSDRPVHK